MTEEHAVQDELIQGLVAAVLSERELAINIGASHGVKQAMKFKVLARAPTKILDPVTGDLLGSVDREKVRVQATDVHEEFSVCKTYQMRYTEGGTWAGVLRGASINPFLQPGEIPETLKVEDSSLPLPLPEEDSYVKTGDRVVQIVE